MKTAITKILFLIMIIFVSVIFTGCGKSDKTTSQNNNEQISDNPVSSVPVHSNEINSAADVVIEDKIKTLSSVDVIEEDEKHSENNTSDWLTYTNAKAKYKISHPKTYAITEYKNNLEIVSLNFKDTSNVDYHGGEIYIKTGNEADTADSVLAEIKKNCEDEYGLCAEVSEDKIINLSSFKAQKIRYTAEIGGETISYFFTGENGEKFNFELSLNWEDEVREKIINSFEFF